MLRILPKPQRLEEKKEPCFWITIAELQLRTIAQKKHTFMQSSCQSSLNTRQASSLALTGVQKTT